MDGNVHLPAAPPIQPNPNQQVIIIQAGPRAPRPRKILEKYPGKTAQGLGIIRIVCGILFIIIQAISIGIESNGHYFRNYEIEGFNYSSSGVWCGIFFILAGSFGISAGRVKSFCLIVTNLILSILSASLFGSVVVFVNLGAVIKAADLQNEYDNYEIPSWRSDDPYNYHYDKGEAPTPFLGTFSLMLVAAIIEVICDVMTAVICCKHVCCCNYSTPDQNVVDPGVLGAQGQQVLYTSDPRAIVGQGGYPFAVNGITIPNTSIPPGNIVAEPAAPPAYSPPNHDEVKEAVY